MDKPELQQIAAFLNDVQEGLCEGDEATTLACPALVSVE